MNDFRLALEFCDLLNLGHKGSFYTWSNRHETPTYTKESLHRAVVNPSWTQMYDAIQVECIIARSLTINHYLSHGSGKYTKEERV